MTDSFADAVQGSPPSSSRVLGASDLPLAQRIPVTQRPKVLLLPSATPNSASGWSIVLYIYCHLVAGMGTNPRMPIDHHLLRWFLDAPRASDAAAAYARAGGGEIWMWKQAAGLYCLILASSHPEVEAWARLPVGSAERRVAEERDDAGLIEVRKWFEGLLRPEPDSLNEDNDAGVAEVAERFLDWSTTQAFVDKLAWLEGEEGQRLASKLWRDAIRRPLGFTTNTST